MAKSNTSSHAVDPQYFLSLTEIKSSYGVPTETIIEIIEEGIVNIDNQDNPDTWQFDNEACRKIRFVLQLEKDLGVNVAGSGLALELLEQIEELRALLALHRDI